MAGFWLYGLLRSFGVYQQFSAVPVRPFSPVLVIVRLPQVSTDWKLPVGVAVSV